MKAPRVLGFLVWLVLAFSAGQQIVLLHGLSHAVQKEAPAPNTPCADCAVASQVGGVPGMAGLPAVAVLAGAVLALALVATTPAASRVALYRSRAPPRFL